LLVVSTIPVETAEPGAAHGEGVDLHQQVPGTIRPACPATELQAPLEVELRIPEHGGFEDSEINPRDGHFGVDLTAQEGTSVLAADEGTVLRIAFQGQGGWYVFVKHTHGLTGYFH